MILLEECLLNFFVEARPTCFKCGKPAVDLCFPDRPECIECHAGTGGYRNNLRFRLKDSSIDEMDYFCFYEIKVFDLPPIAEQDKFIQTAAQIFNKDPAYLTERFNQSYKDKYGQART